MILEAEFKEVGHTLNAGFGTVVRVADSEVFSEAFKIGQLSVLENSKYMNATEIGNVVTINNRSSIEHELKVKIQQPLAENLLTAPYNLPYTYDMGVEYTINSTSLSVNGIASGLPNGVPVEQFETLASTFEAGKTYYTGFIYLKGDASSNPLSIGFHCSGANGGTYGTSEVVWDSAFNSKFLVITAQEGINYDCEVMPIVSDKPIGSGGVDLSTVSVSRYGKNLLQFPYYTTTRTISGITYTVGENGSLTIEGTATANATFNFILASYNSALPLKAGNYTLSLGTPNTAYTQFRLGTIAESGSIVVKADIRYSGEKEKVFTLDADTRVYMNCIVGKGDTVPKTTFYPMLEFGSTATTYEPYIKPQTVQANADGIVEGIETLPNMTLIPDNQNVILECQYLRDIDTFIDDLMISVALTGGE